MKSSTENGILTSVAGEVMPGAMSASIVMPMLRMVPVTPEIGYMTSARNFLPSFELLVGSGAQHLRAGALVGGLIVECLLKAVIAAGDVISHDLQELWAMAAQKIPLDPVVPDWCVILNTLHFGNKDPQNIGESIPVPKQLRYPLRYQSRMNGLVYPVQNDMLEGVLALRSTVETYLAPAR